MKMNFGKRLVLFLHWLMSLIAVAMTVMFCAFPETIVGLLEKLNALIGARKVEIIAIAALAVYVILTVLAAVIILSGKRRKGQRGLITVDSSEAGKTRIAVGAVEQMIRQAVRGVDGITEMKSGIINHEDSISINTSVVVANGAHVPTVTMNIQRAIRSYIELNCGVAVREVSVNVHAVEPSAESGRRLGRKPVESAFAPKQAAESAPQASAAKPEYKTEPAYKPEPAYRPEPKYAPEPVAEPAYTPEPIMETDSEEPVFSDEPIRLTFDPPREMISENHPIDEQ